MMPLESLCIDQMYKRQKIWQGQAKDKTFKLVNAMLDVVDRDGLYGAVVYLQAYDNKSGNGNAILSAFNSILKKIGLAENELSEDVTPANLANVKQWYGKHVSDDDPRSALAEMALKRLLIHLRFETKVVA